MNMIETKRLVVKPTSMDNFENIYSLYSDPEVMRYIGKGVKTRDESHERILLMIKHHQKHGFSAGDVYEKDTGDYVGRSGLMYLELNDNQPEIEVGYVLHKKFWGKGYATELAEAFIAWGLSHLPTTYLIAVVRPENKASRHVLEKCGMKYVGTMNCYEGENAKYKTADK